MTIYDDLAAARAEMPHPKMDSTGRAGKNGSRVYPYASLKSVLDAVMPPLMKRGVFLTQRIGGSFLKTEARKGEEIAYLDERPIDLLGSPQEQGSAETYAKRYALCSVFCLSGDEDDDGKAASQKQRKEPSSGGKAAKDAADRRNAAIGRIRELLGECEAKGVGRDGMLGWAEASLGTTVPSKMSDAQLAMFERYLKGMSASADELEEDDGLAD